MNLYPVSSNPVRRGLALALLATFLQVLPALAQRPVSDTGNSRITGVVSNGATRTLLEGAAVEIPALGRRTLTDNLGRFSFDLWGYTAYSYYVFWDATEHDAYH